MGVRDDSFRGVNEYLCLVNILQRRDASLFTRARKIQRVGARHIGALRNFEFQVQAEQLVISRGDLGHQGLAHGALGLHTRVNLGAGRFVRAPDTSPQIYFVTRHGEKKIAEFMLRLRARWKGDLTVLRRAGGLEVAAGIDRWEKLRADDTSCAFSLQDPRGGD